jgi:hypothetical protein
VDSHLLNLLNPPESTEPAETSPECQHRKERRKEGEEHRRFARVLDARRRPDIALLEALQQQLDVLGRNREQYDGRQLDVERPRQVPNPPYRV